MYDIVAGLQEGPAQKPERAQASDHTVRQQNATLPGGHLLQTGNLRAKDPLNCIFQVTETFCPQVRDLQPVTQQIVAVQLDDGVEVEQRFDAGGEQHDEGEKID